MALTQVDGGLLSPTNGQFYGMKSRIINGAMVIDQRNAGASVTPTASAYTLDRWRAVCSVASKFSVQQNAGSVTPPVGFQNYLGVTSLAATSLGASDQYRIDYAIEGFNVSDLDFGTANASTVTFSFRVYSSLTGSFGAVLCNGAFNRSYPFSYTIPVANTWTTITVTIAGDTTGTWAKNNTAGMYVSFSLGVGSSLVGTANAWAASTILAPTSSVSVVGTSGATFYITGVQLEKGSTATSFDYRPYGTELALCQRYYAKLGANPQGSSTYQAYGAGGNTNVNTAQNIHLPYPQFMRASPTVAFSGNIGVTVNATYLNVSLATAYGGVSSSLVQTLSAAIGSAGQGAVLISNGDATAFISLTAEL